MDNRRLIPNRGRYFSFPIMLRLTLGVAHQTYYHMSTKVKLQQRETSKYYFSPYSYYIMWWDSVQESLTFSPEAELRTSTGVIKSRRSLAASKGVSEWCTTWNDLPQGDGEDIHPPFCATSLFPYVLYRKYTR